MIKILSGDHYKIRGRLHGLIDDFSVGEDTLTHESVDLESTPLNLGDLLDLLTATSLFNPQRMIILRGLGARKEFANQAELIFSKVSEGICLIVVEPKLDKRGQFASFLRKQPGYEECRPHEGRQLEDELIRLAGVNCSQLERPAAAYLVQRVGSDLIALESEIKKLSAHQIINRSLIDELVVPTPASQVFDLLDALMAGDIKKTLSLYADQRQQKSEALSILGILVWQLRIFLIAKSNPRRSNSEIAEVFNLSKYALSKAQPVVRNLPAGHLAGLIKLCQRTDERIRRRFINPDSALRFLIIKGCYLARRP